MIILKNRHTGLLMPCMMWHDDYGAAVVTRWMMPSPIGCRLVLILPDDCEDWQLWEAKEEDVKDLSKSGYPWVKALAGGEKKQEKER